MLPPKLSLTEKFCCLGWIFLPPFIIFSGAGLFILFWGITSGNFTALISGVGLGLGLISFGSMFLWIFLNTGKITPQKTASPNIIPLTNNSAGLLDRLWEDHRPTETTKSKDISKRKNSPSENSLPKEAYFDDSQN